MEVADLPDFWQWVRNANNRFLGLDYDGTLAPFEIDPMQAKPLPGIVDLLWSLAEDGQTQIAIISGRPATQVLTLLDNPPVTVVGSHGYELKLVDEDCLVRQPTAEQLQGLYVIRKSIQKRSYSYKMETKISSIALHTRGMDPLSANVIEEELLAEWGGWALHYGLECRRFNGGIEFRCIGWNKGNALKSLLDLQPENTLSTYIGDDDTDEDAFTIIHGRGIGIKVGESSWPTAARGFLPDCRAVVSFLQTWAALTITMKGQK